MGTTVTLEEAAMEYRDAVKEEQAAGSVLATIEANRVDAERRFYEAQRRRVGADERLRTAAKAVA